MLSLCPAEFLAERRERETQKRETLKQQWIAEHMENPSLDYDIIFKTDDEIHDGVKLQFSFHDKKDAAAAEKAKEKTKSSRKDYGDHAKMTPEDWEHAFDTLLSLHLINVPQGFYQDKLYFTNTKVLKDMFNKLELDNLQMIH